MNNTGIKNYAMGALAAVITCFALASCGGGGTSSPLPLDNGNGVAPGTTNINGTVVQSTDVKASSAAGEGLPGLLVSLINTSSGQLTGTDVTDSFGKYEFKGMPSGDGYLVKIEFESSQDLDGDGQRDEIELYFPVDLADQAVMEILQQIGVSDSDNDGQLDAVEVEFRSSDDSGNHSHNRRQHRRRSGETRVDDNNDGSFDDSFDDSDADGLPDDSSISNGSDDSSGMVHELEVKGVIEAISTDSISVGGTSFMLGSSTSWRIDDDRNADPSKFTVGTFVEVEGFSDGKGGWIASKVKTEDDFGTGNDDLDDDNGGEDNGGEDINDDNGGDDDSGSDDNGDDLDDDGDDDDSGSGSDDDINDEDGDDDNSGSGSDDDLEDDGDDDNSGSAGDDDNDDEEEDESEDD